MAVHRTRARAAKPATKPAQAVNRVWAAAEGHLPEGFERVTAVLPEHQAFIVKKWEAEARRKQEPKS